MDSAVIGVTVEIDGEILLFKYDQNITLKENITLVVEQHNAKHGASLDINRGWALKLLPDPKRNPNISEHYIVDRSVKDDIQNAYSLKLVESVSNTVDRLFKHINEDSLFKLSNDMVFVDEIVNSNRQGDLIKFLISGTLGIAGEKGVLNVLFNILKSNYPFQMDELHIEKIIEIVKANTASTSIAISIINNILINPKESTFKSIILSYLKLADVMPYFKEYTYKDSEGNFYRGLLRLINSMIANSKLETRSAMLDELNSMENREILYNFLCGNPRIGKHVAYEVFVLQARLLTYTYNEYYSNRSSISSLSSIMADDSKRSSMASEEEEQERNKHWVMNLKKAESTFSIVSEMSLSKIPCLQLVSMSLDYGRHYYSIYFESLAKSDYSCDDELYNISSNLITILTNLLCIGTKTHTSSYYLPMYFAPLEMQMKNRSRSVQFLEELFVKTLILFFRTKSEIRARSKDDFKKLYQIVSKQLRLIFDLHPNSFDDWDRIAREVNYEKVQEKLKEEREQQWKYMYKHNQCLQELALHCTIENQLVIKEQRFNVLKKGYMFPNMSKKKGDKHTQFFLQLRPNHQKLLYCEYFNGNELKEGSKYLIAACDIKHVIVGEACPLIKNNMIPASKRDCAFSINYVLNDEGFTLNCYFENDRKTARLWMDGINLLIDKDISLNNKAYEEELNMLNEMECAMQLIELQDIEIPVEPPPIPDWCDHYALSREVPKLPEKSRRFSQLT